MERLKPQDRGDLYPAATLTMGLMATIISDRLTVTSSVGEVPSPTDFSSDQIVFDQSLELMQ